MNRTAILYALISATLFGATTPAAKILVGTIHPAILAGLLYCGAGGVMALLRKILPSIMTTAPEVPLTRSELPWLAGAITTGGVIGPLLLMAGLAHTDAAAASLLLTLEGAATALMAWFIFHENFDRRIALGTRIRMSPTCTTCISMYEHSGFHIFDRSGASAGREHGPNNRSGAATSDASHKTRPALLPNQLRPE